MNLTPWMWIRICSKNNQTMNLYITNFEEKGPNANICPCISTFKPSIWYLSLCTLMMSWWSVSTNISIQNPQAISKFLAQNFSHRISLDLRILSAILLPAACICRSTWTEVYLHAYIPNLGTWLYYQPLFWFQLKIHFYPGITGGDV